jgi:hypothetical protein
MKDTKVKSLQPNVKEANNKDSLDGKELVQREEVKDSPFSIVTIEGESFGVMGEYRLTEKKSSKATIKRELEKITWNRIIQVIMLLDDVKDRAKNLKVE